MVNKVDKKQRWGKREGGGADEREEQMKIKVWAKEEMMRMKRKMPLMGGTAGNWPSSKPQLLPLRD